MKSNKYLVVSVLIIAIGLGGCGSTVEPTVVLNNMYKSMSTVEQFEFSGDINLSGGLQGEVLEGLTDLELSVDGEIDLASLADLKYLINLMIDGQSDDGATRIGAEVKSFLDYNYFRMTDISLPLGLPFSLIADDKWYKVKKPSDQGSNVLGSTKSITDQEFNQIRDLINSSSLFFVQQSLPEQTINGVRAYHLRATINEQSWSEFLTQLNNIMGDGSRIDPKPLVQLLNRYTYDLWITAKDYKLTRIAVNGTYDDNNNEVGFEIEINLTNFDTPINIIRPSEVQEFKIDNLLGFPLGGF